MFCVSRPPRSAVLKPRPFSLTTGVCSVLGGDSASLVSSRRSDALRPGPLPAAPSAVAAVAAALQRRRLHTTLPPHDRMRRMYKLVKKGRLRPGGSFHMLHISQRIRASKSAVEVAETVSQHLPAMTPDLVVAALQQAPRAVVLPLSPHDAALVHPAVDALVKAFEKCARGAVGEGGGDAATCRAAAYAEQQPRRGTPKSVSGFISLSYDSREPLPHSLTCPTATARCRSYPCDTCTRRTRPSPA